MTDYIDVAIILNKCNNFVTITICKEEGNKMKKYGKKLFALALASGLIVGSVCSVQAAMVGSEEQVEGATVLLEQYCSNVANGTVDAKASDEVSKLFDSTIKNTLLTDYIKEAYKDKRVKKFVKSGVYAPENSISLYKMYSSYLTVVPKDQMPIDMEKLNEAILGERGYYDMLLKTEIERKSVLRFNLQAFKNNYNLVDLSKMKLTYFGIKVGTCGENHLSIDKEFDFQPAEDKTTAEEIVEGEKSAAEEEKELDVYDIVLAGVVREED